MTAIESAPVLKEGSGAERFEGQLLLTVNESFDTQSLAWLYPGIALLYEGTPDQRGARSLLVQLPDEQLNAALIELRLIDGVIAADKHILFRLTDVPNDPLWPTQKYAGAYLFNLDAAWNITHGRSSVRVAVLDTGVNDVPDLYPQLDPGLSFLEIPPDEDTSDSVGHGTQVASIIAGTHSNGASITGIAPGVRVVPVRVCYLNVFLGVYCPGLSVSDALGWVADQNIDVVNLSITPTDQVDSIKYRVDVLALRNAIVVGAAGNGGEGAVEFPASYGPVVAVAGTNPNGSRHDLSNYGSDLDFAAPFTTVALSQFGYTESFSGTSAAAPAIAGLAALYKSEYPIELQKYPEHSFVSIAGRFTNQGAWNIQTGRGVPDAWKMLWYGACSRFDFNGNRQIDIGDVQTIAYRYGTFWGSSPVYSFRYDLQPEFVPDLDIDIVDLQRVMGRAFTTCKV